MVHRRLKHDDDRGVEEPLNELGINLLASPYHSRLGWQGIKTMGDPQDFNS